MAAFLTVGDLFKAKTVTDEQVSAAVETYLMKPDTSAHTIADGYTVNLAAAVESHGWASQITARPKTNLILKRAAVQTAILLARVRKAQTRVKRDRTSPAGEP